MELAQKSGNIHHTLPECNIPWNFHLITTQGLIYPTSLRCNLHGHHQWYNWKWHHPPHYIMVYRHHVIITSFIGIYCHKKNHPLRVSHGWYTLHSHPQCTKFIYIPHIPPPITLPGIFWLWILVNLVSLGCTVCKVNHETISQRWWEINPDHK